MLNDSIFTDEEEKLVTEIMELKRQKNAVIIAHLYQWPQIQEIADFVGDSLELSRKAKATDADVIVFCGVYFMAETAKILNPGKTVLLPEIHAGCPMADMITPETVKDLRRLHPQAAVVCYVNSSAEVKAECDICCTSSNAVKVVQSLEEKEIIFVPDQNLGDYVSQFVPDKSFIFANGFCPTHHKITALDVEKARQAKPGVPVLVHPECKPEVVSAADYVGSTAQIIDYVANSTEDVFIIGTEVGIIHALQKRCPGKKFYSLHAAMVCPNMKKTTLLSVRDSLAKMQYNIEVDKNISDKAFKSLDRMLQIV
jgi:quinolinate synthase